MDKILSKKWAAMLCAALCTALWGSAYPVIKYSYSVLPLDTTGDKLMFAGVRFILAGAMVYAFAWARSRRIPVLPRKSIGGVLLYGTVQTGLMYICNYIGVANTTATKTSIITAASAFFAVIFAPLFFKDERLTALKAVGVVVGMAGIVLINNTALDGFSPAGEGLVLLATILNTAGGFIGKRVSKGIVYESTACQLGFGGLIILAAAAAMGGRLPLSATGFLLLMYLAFVSAAAFTLWTALLVRWGAGQIMVYNLLIPVTGAIWSYLILGERRILEPLYLLSLALTVIGIFLVNHPQKNKIN